MLVVANDSSLVSVANIPARRTRHSIGSSGIRTESNSIRTVFRSNRLTEERGCRWQLEVSVNFRRHGGMCKKSATTDFDPDPARKLALVPMDGLLAQVGKN